MILSALFEKFVQQSPISVMARGTLEHALAAEDIDQLFANAADRQYTCAYRKCHSCSRE